MKRDSCPITGSYNLSLKTGNKKVESRLFFTFGVKKLWLGSFSFVLTTRFSGDHIFLSFFSISQPIKFELHFDDITQLRCFKVCLAASSALDGATDPGWLVVGTLNTRWLFDCFIFKLINRRSAESETLYFDQVCWWEL